VTTRLGACLVRQDAAKLGSPPLASKAPPNRGGETPIPKGTGVFTDAVVAGLDVYVVGGAVRDALLGRPSGDRDWVVVGATPEIMAQRGFIPVGGDFPVFLHPHTKEEYALARTERKSGRGYKGFTFYCGAEVTLQDDLRRRDLTINAMAQTRDGALIDPYDGAGDIQRRVLRHVGAAFAEDPVRLLRLARFAAGLPDFTIASETLALCQGMVHAGEVDALVPERVWRELEKSLASARPDRFLDVLAQTGALARVLPGLAVDPDVLWGLLRGVDAQIATPGRFALLCRQSQTPDAIARHLRAPGAYRDQAVLLPELIAMLCKSSDTPESWLACMQRCDAWRKPARFLELLAAAACVIPVDLSAWSRRLHAVRGVNAGAVAQSVQGANAIRHALRRAWLDALATDYSV